jgi:hypothetical protein
MFFLTIVFVGGFHAMSNPSFAIVNNLPDIAKQLPRLPDANMLVQLVRGGATSTSHRLAYFRPLKVNLALQWLKENNPLYCEIDISPLSQNKEKVEVQGTADISETDNVILESLLSEAEANPSSIVDSAEGDLLLLEPGETCQTSDDVIIEKLREVAGLLRKNEHTQNDADGHSMDESSDHGPTTVAPHERDQDTMNDESLNTPATPIVHETLEEEEKQESPPKRPKLVLEVNRVEGRPHPKDDPYFYAKCFPHLFPFGDGCIDFDDHIKLVLSRYDTRFAKDPRFYFSFYSYHMNKKSGGVAQTATKFTNSRSDEFSNILNTDLTVDQLVKILSNNDSAEIEHLLRTLEPYSNSMPGTAAHIKNERNKLFSMISSPVLTRATVFGTNSPCDLYNPEFFALVVPGQKHVEFSLKQRQKLLRDNPAIAVRVMEARVNAIFDYIYKGKAEPFGKVLDYWIRVEFQSN